VQFRVSLLNFYASYPAKSVDGVNVYLQESHQEILQKRLSHVVRAPTYVAPAKA
jgi:hypothetical protein